MPQSVDARWTRAAHGGFAVVVVCAWVMVAIMVAGLPRLRRDTTQAATSSRLPAEVDATGTPVLPPELPGMPFELPDELPDDAAGGNGGSRTDQS